MTRPQTVNRYSSGDLIRFTATFSDENGQPGDPDFVTFKFMDAQGNINIYDTNGNVARAATGAYYIDLPVTLSGSSFYRWEGTGGIQKAEDWAIVVAPSFFL